MSLLRQSPLAVFPFAFLAALSTVLALAAVPGPAAAQGKGRAAVNLLGNPGFDEGGLFSPTDWDTTVAGVPTVLFFWDAETRRGGGRSASLINAGDALPVWHNWNQMLLHAGRFAGRDLELTVWVRSAQMEGGGRGYVMLQAYRDTVMNLARDEGITRDQARQKMGFKFADDPQLELGWARQYFSAEHAEWTPKTVRLHIPPTTNLVIVRLGIYGPGQVWFDDAQLASLPPARTPLPVGRNLLANEGFERPLDDWEFSMPPTAGATIVTDTTVARSGSASLLLFSPTKPPFQTYMNACQVFNARDLAGKRVRLSGWAKLEDLIDSAYLSVFSTGLYGVDGSLAGDALTGTKDWTFYTVDFDVPKDTYTVWARAGFQAGPGKVWWDDLKFEVLGPSPKPVVSQGTSR
jgi:hypothetical protein